MGGTLLPEGGGDLRAKMPHGAPGFAPIWPGPEQTTNHVTLAITEDIMFKWQLLVEDDVQLRLGEGALQPR
jgi:hypothetical protein